MYVYPGIKMIEVTVKNILFFSRADDPGYTLFLQPLEEESRSLPIVIGQFEAQAIAMAIEGIKLDRPMAHDLLSTVINSLTDGLESVVINDLKEGTFYAQLNIRSGETFETIDARPSDAIALALRARIPIRVAKQVFDTASVPILLSESKEQEFKPSLTENVREITRRAELRFDLERDLREAVSQEDYELAVKIRDRLHTLSDQNS